MFTLLILKSLKWWITDITRQHWFCVISCLPFWRWSWWNTHLYIWQDQPGVLFLLQFACFLSQWILILTFNRGGGKIPLSLVLILFSYLSITPNSDQWPLYIFYHENENHLNGMSCNLQWHFSSDFLSDTSLGPTEERSRFIKRHPWPTDPDRDQRAASWSWLWWESRDTGTFQSSSLRTSKVNSTLGSGLDVMSSRESKGRDPLMSHSHTRLKMFSWNQQEISTSFPWESEWNESQHKKGQDQQLPLRLGLPRQW